jgi:hypothetical protein
MLKQEQGAGMTSHPLWRQDKKAPLAGRFFLSRHLRRDMVASRSHDAMAEALMPFY